VSDIFINFALKPGRLWSVSYIITERVPYCRY